MHVLEYFERFVAERLNDAGFAAARRTETGDQQALRLEPAAHARQLFAEPHERRNDVAQAQGTLQRPQASLHSFPIARLGGAQNHPALAISAPEACDVFFDAWRIEQPLPTQDRSVVGCDRPGVHTTQQVTNELLRRRGGGDTERPHAIAQQLVGSKHDMTTAQIVGAHLYHQELRTLFATGAAEPINLDPVGPQTAIDELELVACAEGAQQYGHPLHDRPRHDQLDAVARTAGGQISQYTVVDSFVVEKSKQGRGGRGQALHG